MRISFRPKQLKVISMRLLLASIFLFIAGPAFAGCANYVDDLDDSELNSPAPQVVICYKGNCEETELEYECANASGAQFGYTNKWYVNFKLEGEETTVRVTRPDKTTINSTAGITCYVEPKSNEYAPCRPFD